MDLIRNTKRCDNIKNNQIATQVVEQLKVNMNNINLAVPKNMESEKTLAGLLNAHEQADLALKSYYKACRGGGTADVSQSESSENDDLSIPELSEQQEEIFVQEHMQPLPNPSSFYPSTLGLPPYHTLGSIYQQPVSSPPNLTFGTLSLNQPTTPTIVANPFATTVATNPTTTITPPTSTIMPMTNPLTTTTPTTPAMTTSIIPRMSNPFASNISMGSGITTTLSNPFSSNIPKPLFSPASNPFATNVPLASPLNSPNSNSTPTSFPTTGSSVPVNSFATNPFTTNLGISNPFATNQSPTVQFAISGHAIPSQIITNPFAIHQ
eukprot:TRINITY_DN2606_c0_g1_i18.p1 TRINITY_DN2606_c0_g1~~TRINITY_DN2606_c0_g1_i18.p1  ORF type:complete len:323 (-),score=71.24 TRINITY_DN2606_c0_g1_i18:298-1266(-)